MAKTYTSLTKRGVSTHKARYLISSLDSGSNINEKHMNRVTVIGIFILLMPWIQLNAQNNEQDRKQVREFLKAVDALSRSVQTHSAFQPDFRSWLIQQPEPQIGRAHV